MMFLMNGLKKLKVVMMGLIGSILTLKEAEISASFGYEEDDEYEWENRRTQSKVNADIF